MTPDDKLREALAKAKPGEAVPVPPGADLRKAIRPPLAIEFKKLYPDAELPIRVTESSAGLDVSAYLISETGRRTYALIPPRTSRVVSTGLVLIAPPGFLMLVCSRSGLASERNPVFVANAPGVIDPDYTGELKIILYNGGHESVNITHGQRIAQILLIQHHTFPFREITTLPQTARGDKGFGSSG